MIHGVNRPGNKEYIRVMKALVVKIVVGLNTASLWTCPSDSAANQPKNPSRNATAPWSIRS